MYFAERRCVSHEPTIEHSTRPADSGRIFRPVSSALLPSIVCRYTGITKKSAAIAKYCTRNPARPLRSAGIDSRLTFSSGLRPASSSLR